MPRQLTPEEMKIIRQTEEDGAAFAEKEGGRNRWMHIAKGAAIFIIVFAAFACIAYAVVSGTAR